MLSDAEKRSQYDRFGHAGLSGGFDYSQAGMGDILSQFQEMFSDFFGGAGSASAQRKRSGRGQDVRVHATVSLADAMSGGKHEVVINGEVTCETCSGSGAKAGTKPKPVLSAAAAGR